MVMMLTGATIHRLVLGNPASRYNYVVDPANGNDAQSGRPGAPFKTFAPLSAIVTFPGGTRIGVKRAPTEQLMQSALDIAGTNLLVESFGSGVNPYIDCRDVIPANAWSLASGKTLTYQASVTQTILPGLNNLGNAWEDENFQTQVTSAAAAEALAASMYFSDWASATPTIYVHASDGSNPASSGKVYRYSSRPFAIRITGDGATVRGFRTRGNAAQNGSIIFSGHRGLVDQCRIEDGCRHALYMYGDARVTSTYFYRGKNDIEGNANFLVVNEPDLTGRSFSTANCTFDAGGLGSITAISAHDGNNLGVVSAVHDNPTIIGCGFTPTNAATLTINNPVLSGALDLLSDGAASTVIVTNLSGTLASGTYRLVNVTTGGTITFNGGTLTVPTIGLGIIYGTSTAADLNVTFTGAWQITAQEAVAASTVCLAKIARGTFTIGGVALLPAIGNPISVVAEVGVGATGALVSAGNTYPLGAAWTLNGTTYGTLAALQAAGKDTGSVTGARTASFSDDFNRADENLEASANWTRSGGAAAQAAVRSNQLGLIGTTQTTYVAPLMASADHWVQGTVAGVGTAGSFPLMLRWVDASNWVGARWSTTAYQVYKCVAGTLTQIVNVAATPTVGDIVVLDARNAVAYLYINGACLGQAPIPVTAGKHAGTVPRTTVLNPAIDNFSCGIAA